MVVLTLVTGNNAASREAAIARAIVAPDQTAVILEGLPSGRTALDDHIAHGLQLFRLAPACMCCSGNLALRVYLNRILRAKPKHLFLAPASVEHLPELRAFLAAPPYDALVQLAPVLDAPALLQPERPCP